MDYFGSTPQIAERWGSAPRPPFRFNDYIVQDSTPIEITGWCATSFSPF